MRFPVLRAISYLAGRPSAHAVSLLLLLFPACAASAQDNSAGSNIGQQAYKMYAENSVESVNVSNGNLNLQIPFADIQAEGQSTANRLGY